MTDVNGLIHDIESLLSDPNNRTQKRPLVDIYRRAFPLSDLDESCRGCLNKMWNKLVFLQSQEYKTITMATSKNPSKKWRFADEFKGNKLFIPRMGIHGQTEDQVSDATMERMSKDPAFSKYVTRVTKEDSKD